MTGAFFVFCSLRFNTLNSKLKNKKYKQKTSPQIYKTENKILAKSGFEQYGPGARFLKASKTYKACKAIAKSRTLRLHLPVLFTYS